LSVRIPADVDRPDEILFGLTARQVAVLAVVAVAEVAGWRAVHGVVPGPVAGVVGVVVAAAALGLVLGRRDGLGLDQLLTAAVRQRLAPRRLIPAPGPVRGAPSWVAAQAGPLPAPLRLPPQAINATGVIDLGADGVAVVAACSTLNLGCVLRRSRPGWWPGSGGG
jgi:hypothetical protein